MCDLKPRNKALGNFIHVCTCTMSCIYSTCMYDYIDYTCTAADLACTVLVGGAGLGATGGG